MDFNRFQYDWLDFQSEWAGNGLELMAKDSGRRDVGMEFGDVGCVRISFAVNANPF